MEYTICRFEPRLSKLVSITKVNIFCSPVSPERKRKSMKFHYLAGESRNVHGVGREAHAERHGRLHAQKPGNQLLQLLVDVQVPWWATATTVSLSPAPRAKPSARELRFQSAPRVAQNLNIAIKKKNWECKRLNSEKALKYCSEGFYALMRWLQRAKCCSLILKAASSAAAQV